MREREREIKRDTWIVSIGWGCDRAGLRGGGFIGVFWAYTVVDFGPFFLCWGSLRFGVSLLFI